MVHLNVCQSGIVFDILDTDQLPVIFHTLNHVSIRDVLAAVECVCTYIHIYTHVHTHTHTHTHTEFVNRNVAAFWDVFNCSYDDGDNRIHGTWTNLKVKTSLSSVVILQLCVFFFWLSVGNNSLKFSSFKIPILKYLKKILPVIFQMSKVWTSPSSFAQNTLWIQYFCFTNFLSGKR